MLIPVRVTIPRVGKGLGTPKSEFAEVPWGEVVRAAAQAVTETCSDLELRILMREALEAAEKAKAFRNLKEETWQKR